MTEARYKEEGPYISVHHIAPKICQYVSVTITAGSYKQQLIEFR